MGVVWVAISDLFSTREAPAMAIWFLRNYVLFSNLKLVSILEAGASKIDGKIR